jgi:hypothetical protein
MSGEALVRLGDVERRLFGSLSQPQSPITA